jgi:protein TonB
LLFSKVRNGRLFSIKATNAMKIKLGICLFAAILTACSTSPETPPAASTGSLPKPDLPERVETTRDATSTAFTLDGYKQDLAHRISQVNSTKVYTTRPQALLRSVVVVKYQVDRDGKLVHSEIFRSNRDRETESIALATLKNTAPFPKPAPHLLRQGRVDILESWLFNNDGRFQLRTIALPQMDR